MSFPDRAPKKETRYRSSPFLRIVSSSTEGRKKPLFPPALNLFLLLAIGTIWFIAAGDKSSPIVLNPDGELWRPPGNAIDN